jgi:allantoicase
VSGFTELPDLASERLGGAVLVANDEFFAPKENLLREAAPVWREGQYTDRGKWMDGWETRRRRTPGHDWCIVRLGLPGMVRGVVVDTAYFKGNYPERCSLEACDAPHDTPAGVLAGPDCRWVELLASTPLAGDTRNTFDIETRTRATHLRLNIYPDGGVARLRVHGEVSPDWQALLSRGGELDLAAVEHGGLVLAASDMFFGHRHNLIMPGRAAGMHDGWETRRRRGPGHDWCIVRLGRAGRISRVEVDTDYFRGNAPDSCSLEGCSADGATLEDLTGPAQPWAPILALTPLQPHTRHAFDADPSVGGVTHVRFNIFPDGGVARLRLFGTVTATAR